MRYERKYKVDDLASVLVAQMVRLHPAAFRKIYPDRWINNIYFDTPDYITYLQNVVGAPQRAKFRIRWYGENQQRVTQARFEIKTKHNELGSKTQIDFEDFELDQLASATQRVNRVAPTFALLRPSLMNRYLRSYYGSSDGKYRLTIDTQLAYHAISLSRGFLSYQFTDPATILELKYDKLEDGNVDRITQFIPFRASKSSKYVTGISLTLG